MNIAIFGTSADPPTIAHQSILGYLSQNYDLTAVYASDNPFKKNQNSLYHRTQMLRLAIEELNVLDDNIKLATDIGDRRTIHTVEKAKQKWGKNVDLTFTIGSDLANQIFSWYQAEKLWPQVKILIIPRQGYHIDSQTHEQLSHHSRGYSIANFALPPVSSTTYRHYQDQNIVSPKVRKYIQTHNLYNLG